MLVRVKPLRRPTVVTAVDDGDEIPYGCVFNSADSTQLYRVGGAGITNQICTRSIWVKKHDPDQYGVISGIRNPSSPYQYHHLLWAGTGQLQIVNWTGGVVNVNKLTEQMFRDTSEYMHIVEKINTQLADSEDRVQLFVNNNRIENWATNTVTLGLSGSVYYGNNNFEYFLGANTTTPWPTTEIHSDITTCHDIYVDGQALDPDNFGRYNSEGRWVPKDYAGTYGTEGHHLDFAIAANLGNDISGNASHFSTRGTMGTANQLTDTPTKTYATLCPLHLNQGSAAILADGNLNFTGASRSAGASMSIKPNTGKWGFQVTHNSGTHFAIGIGSDQFFKDWPGTGVGFGSDAAGESYCWYPWAGNKMYQNVQTAYGGSGIAATDTFDCIYDSDTGDLSFRRNGSDKGVAWTIDNTKTWIFGINHFNVDAQNQTANFGQRTFTDALPAGVKELYRQNLPDPAYLNPTDGHFSFIAREPEVYNIFDRLRSYYGWGSDNYVRICKNLTTGESWAWQFGNDTANEHTVSTTHTYVTERAMSINGSDNWLCIGLRVGVNYGIRVIEFEHTNGTPTTVNHGLNAAKQVIAVFARRTVDVFWNHRQAMQTDYSCRLNTTAAESLASMIVNVGDNSFDVDSPVASGIYDALIIAPVDQFSDVYHYDGQAAANGAFQPMDFNPELDLFVRGITLASNTVQMDRARNPYNEMDRMNYLSADTVETTTHDNDCDYVSNGIKARANSGARNYSNAHIHTGVAFARYPAKWNRADPNMDITPLDEYILSLAPRMYLPLNETTGTAADDLSQNGNDGVYVNSPDLGQGGLASPLFGVPGASVYLDDSTEEHIYVTDDANLDFDANDAVTLFGFIKSTDTSDWVMMAKIADDNSFGWMVYKNNTNNKVSFMLTTSRTLQMTTTADPGITDGNTHLWVYRKTTDHTAAGSSLWIDGVSVALTTDLDTLVAADSLSSTYAVTIGCKSSGPSTRAAFFANFNASRVGLIDRAITDAEIVNMAKKAGLYAG